VRIFCGQERRDSLDGGRLYFFVQNIGFFKNYSESARINEVEFQQSGGGGFIPSDTDVDLHFQCKKKIF